MMKNIFFNVFFLSAVLLVVSGRVSSARGVAGIETSRVFPFLANTIVYDQAVNPVIGITPDGNVTGNSFVITDETGKTVMRGVMKPGKTFYITTGKLGKGCYHFLVGNQVLQQFIIE